MAQVTCVCGAVYDYAHLPTYSGKLHRPGRYCPDCGHPADEETAKRDGAHPGQVRAAQAMEAQAKGEKTAEEAHGGLVYETDTQRKLRELEENA